MIQEANSEQSLAQSYPEVRPENHQMNELLRKLDNEMEAEGQGQEGQRK